MTIERTAWRLCSDERWRPFGPSPDRHEGEDLRQRAAEDRVTAVRIRPAVPTPTVVPVVVAAPEAFTEVIVVVGLTYVIAAIAEVCIPIGIGRSKVKRPSVLPVRLAKTEAFVIAVVHGLAEQVRAVLVRLVVTAAAVVAIDRRREKVRIVVVVVAFVIPKTGLLLLQPRGIRLLHTVQRQSALLLQLHSLLLRKARLLIERSDVLRHALLLLTDALPLNRLRQALLRLFVPGSR